MADKIQIRRDLAANWTSVNPILADGEFGFEKDTGKLKIGNGTDDWNTLPYRSTPTAIAWGNLFGTLSDQTDLQNALDLKLNIADYNDRYKGKYTTLAALQSAYPTANPGDYAQVDGGAGSDVENYNWDSEDGWIIGGAGSGATNTDGLPEGSTNLYFTVARAQAAVDLSTYLDQTGAKISATASGTDTYTATISPAITAYSATQRFFIKFTNANTGAATLNLNGLGAKTIKKGGSSDLASGDIKNGQILCMAYDGTNFQLVGGSGGGGGSSVTQNISFSGNYSQSIM